MRQSVSFVLLGLAFAFPATAQSSCSPSDLSAAAKAVAQIRHELHEQAVPENSPRVPAVVGAQIVALKEQLAKAAEAVFSCAGASDSPDELQKRLAEALHANLSDAAETSIETRDKRDLGAYGSDLAVQVFPLGGSPPYDEVDFRFGIECGDDNLLLVFANAKPETTHSADAPANWGEVLRWGAPAYALNSAAYGDFVMMTPLSGFPGQRNWRFVVAHGQPSCGAADGPSRFDLDILQPTAEPASPHVVWHLERPYLRNQVPRLSTTEDTLTFELAPPERSARTAKAPVGTGTYRYRVGKDNQVEAIATSDVVPTPQAPAASTNSPQ